MTHFSYICMYVEDKDASGVHTESGYMSLTIFKELSIKACKVNTSKQHRMLFTRVELLLHWKK